MANFTYFSPLLFHRVPQRLNVAITRSQFALWVVGHFDTLRADSEWASLIRFAEEHR